MEPSTAAIAPVLAESNDRGNGSDGSDSARQKRVANQRVEQSGFTALKLTDAGNIKAPFRNPFRRGTCFLFDVLVFAFFGERGDAPEAILFKAFLPLLRSRGGSRVEAKSAWAR